MLQKEMTNNKQLDHSQPTTPNIQTESDWKKYNFQDTSRTTLSTDTLMNIYSPSIQKAGLS